MTIITNTKPVIRIMRQEVLDFINNDLGVPITLEQLGVNTDDVGQSVTIDTTTVTLTAPQITQLENKFFVSNVTPLTTKGDVLSHDDTNEVKKAVGADNTVLTADSTKPDGLDWKPISGGSPLEIESNAVFGLTVNQAIPVAPTVLLWDENFFTGDLTKIVDEGSGIFRLHNGEFVLRSRLALDIDGGGVQSASLAWETSANLGGPFVQIPNPEGRTASYTKGDASITTQPLAVALVDATAADLFVRVVLTPTDTTSVLNLSSSASIQSFGTVAVANTPLTTKGDVLSHDGASEVRKEVGANDTVLTADNTTGDGLAWKTIAGGSPVDAEANAALGLLIDQVIAVSDPIAWDENFFGGDNTKIIDEGSGIISLHNGKFTMSAHLALDISGGGPQSAVLAWESSANVGGPFVTIPNPEARAATYTIGNASITTQPKATAIVDATIAAVFIRVVLSVSSSTTVLNSSSSSTIESFGTSAIANSPLTTKGDLLTNNDTNDVRLPVGLDGQILAALASAPNGLAWINGGFEKIADETLGSVSAFFNVTFPVREFLYIIIFLEPDGGSLNAQFVFNQTTGNEYTYRRDENYGTITTNTNQDRVQLDAGIPGVDVYATLLVFNQAGVDPSFMQRSIGQDAATANTLPQTQIIDGIWAEALGDRVDELNIETTINSFSTNSRVVVYGSKT